jgi:hypothetical protein
MLNREVLDFLSNPEKVNPLEIVTMINKVNLSSPEMNQWNFVKECALQ